MAGVKCDRQLQVTGGPALIVRVFLPFAVGYYLSYLFRTM